MLIQQMKSTPSFKIEAGDVHLPTDQSDSPTGTPSIAVANYNNQYNNMYDHPLLVATPVHTFAKNYILGLPFETGLEDCDFELIELMHYYIIGLPFETGLEDCDFELIELMHYYVGKFSQSMACIATRFRECRCSSTMLHKLWYNYTYIYHQASSNTATIIP